MGHSHIAKTIYKVQQGVTKGKRLNKTKNVKDKFYTRMAVLLPPLGTIQRYRCKVTMTLPLAERD